jgi:hypothetical protein
MKEDVALSNSEKMEQLEGLLIDGLILQLGAGGSVEGAKTVSEILVALLNAKANLVKAYSAV